MRGRKTLFAGWLLGIAMAAMLLPFGLAAQQGAASNRPRRRSMTMTSAGSSPSVWAGSRGLGIAETPTRDPLCQDGVDERAGLYVRAGPAQGELPGVGAGVWSRRLAKGRERARQDPEPDRRGRPSLAAAAQYYPAAYWYSMVKIPDKSLFPGTGDKGNGIPEMFKTQDQWLNFIKTNGCGNCHQMGNYATRSIPENLGKFESSQDAWAYRLSVGPAGHDMVRLITQLMTPDGGQLARLADWTDRIEAGELPAAARRGQSASGGILSSPFATGSMALSAI